MASAATQQQTPIEAPHQDKLLNAMAWVELHRKHLVLASLAFVVVFGAVYLWRQLAAQREASANAALLAVRGKQGDPDSTPKASDFLKIAEAHASTTSASRARLLAAGAFFTEDRYAEARTEFANVLASEGSGPLAAQAAFGVAASLDALDKIDEAAAKYQEVTTQFPDDSVAGEARLALARIQETRKQPEAALKIYDELARDPEAGPFSQQASERREHLIRRFPQLAPTTNAPAAAAVPVAVSNNTVTAVAK